MPEAKYNYFKNLATYEIALQIDNCRQTNSIVFALWEEADNIGELAQSLRDKFDADLPNLPDSTQHAFNSILRDALAETDFLQIASRFDENREFPKFQ